MLASIAKMHICDEHYKQGSTLSSLVSYPPLFKSARIQYPYINNTLHLLWNEALQFHSNPLDAWSSIQSHKEKRKKYTISRGQKNYVRISWQEAMTIIATAFVYSMYKYGPQSIVGIAPQPQFSMASHAAGARFFRLLGAPCISATLDFAGWATLAKASDWLDSSRNPLLPTKEVRIEQLLSSAHIILMWSNTKSSSYKNNVHKKCDNIHLLDLYINASTHSNDDCLLSDIILPSAFNDEYDDISMHLHEDNCRYYLKKHRSLQNPSFESKDNWKLFQEIAENFSDIVRKNIQLQKTEQIDKENIKDLCLSHTDINNKYRCLGPRVTHLHGIKNQHATWDCAKEYEILKAQLGVTTHKSSVYAMPRITSCQDACIIMLALSPQSNPTIKERMFTKNTTI